MAKENKTNAMRKLDSMKLPYQEHHYDVPEAVSGTEVAAMLGQDPCRVFKTLVTEGKSGEHYVFMVPVREELDLKKAAAVVGEKSVAMIKSKELLGLTGYIHGGCSPIGMKKQFRTTVHTGAQQYETILFSGGRIGLQIELAPDLLQKVVPLRYADIIKNAE